MNGSFLFPLTIGTGDYFITFLLMIKKWKFQ